MESRGMPWWRSPLRGERKESEIGFGWNLQPRNVKELNISFFLWSSLCVCPWMKENVTTRSFHKCCLFIGKRKERKTDFLKSILWPFSSQPRSHCDIYTHTHSHITVPGYIWSFFGALSRTDCWLHIQLTIKYHSSKCQNVLDTKSQPVSRLFLKLFACWCVFLEGSF